MSEDLTQNLPHDDLKLILTRLDSIDSRLGGVDSHLTTLEDKVDWRLRETRPIWERALAEIAETREGLEKLRGEMHEELGNLRTEMREGNEKLRADTEMGLYRVERQIEVLNGTILDVRTDIRFLDKRVDKLESEPAQ